METYRITFYRENEDEKEATETIELMARSEVDAVALFQAVEPFTNILKIERI